MSQISNRTYFEMKNDVFWLMEWDIFFLSKFRWEGIVSFSGGWLRYDFSPTLAWSLNHDHHTLYSVFLLLWRFYYGEDQKSEDQKLNWNDMLEGKITVSMFIKKHLSLILNSSSKEVHSTVLFRKLLWVVS